MFAMRQVKAWSLFVCIACSGLVPVWSQNTALIETDLISLKVPPRTVSDVLRAVDGAKVDPAEMAQAREFVLKPVPDSDDVERLHSFYRQRAIAYQRLGKINLSIQDARLITEKYKSSDKLVQLESLFELGIYEQRGGNLKSAIKAFEEGRNNIPSHMSGLYMTANRQLVAAYAQAGNFEASEAALRDAESTLVMLRRAPVYSTLGIFWEANLDAARAINFSYQGRWVEAERSNRLGIRKIERALEDLYAQDANPKNPDPVKTKRSIKGSMQFKVSRQLELANAIMMQGRLVEAESL
jgi:hypothetical protein